MDPSEEPIDLSDPELEKAATKIQATFKGYKSRKEGKPEGSTSPARRPETEPDSQPEEEIDIDLTDPQVEKAATKIQASYKGFKTRKEIRDKTADDS